MADFKGVYAVLLASGLVLAAAGPAGAAAVGDGNPLLAAADSLIDRAESDVVARAPVTFVASALDLGLGRLGGVLPRSNMPAQRSSAAFAAVEIASSGSVFAVTAAVHPTASTVDLLANDTKLADTAWVAPLWSTVRPNVSPDRPLMSEGSPGGVEKAVVSVLSVFGGLRDLMKAGLHDSLAGN